MASNDSPARDSEDETPDYTGLEREEPWWLVGFYMDEETVVTAAVDAPSEEEATGKGRTIIIQREGSQPDHHADTRGPFPKHVPTEEREIRPKMCGGCGLKRYCGNHPPTPPQTWWRLLEEQSTEEARAWECIQCRTLTRMPRIEEGTDEE